MIGDSPLQLRDVATQQLKRNLHPLESSMQFNRQARLGLHLERQLEQRPARGQIDERHGRTMRNTDAAHPQLRGRDAWMGASIRRIV